MIEDHIVAIVKVNKNHNNKEITLRGDHNNKEIILIRRARVFADEVLSGMRRGDKAG